MSTVGIPQGAATIQGQAQATDCKAKIAAYEAALQRAEHAHMHVYARLRPDPRILPGSLFRSWIVMELSEPGSFIAYRVTLEDESTRGYAKEYGRVFRLYCECEEGERTGMCPHMALAMEDFRDQREVLKKVGAA